MNSTSTRQHSTSPRSTGDLVDAARYSRLVGGLGDFLFFLYVFCVFVVLVSFKGSVLRVYSLIVVS